MTKENEEKEINYVDLAGNARASSTTFANLGAEQSKAMSGQPLQFLSMETEKAQMMTDSQDGDGTKVIIQHPSGYLTLKVRVMSEYVYDDKGKKLQTPSVPDPSIYESFNVVMYRRKEGQALRPQPAKEGADNGSVN